MELSKLEKMHVQKAVVEFSGACSDCGKAVSVKSEKLPDDKISIRGGAVYETGGETFFKCPDCFETGKTLRNHRQCEVYSRIVGYLRPISQWNNGKLSEFEKRKTLKV